MGPGQKKRGRGHEIAPRAKALEKYLAEADRLFTGAESPSEKTRAKAIRGIARICLQSLESTGSVPEPVVAYLFETSANSSHSDARRNAAAVLSLIGAEPAAKEDVSPSGMLKESAPALFDSFFSPEREARRMAIFRLGDICISVKGELGRIPRPVARLLASSVSTSQYEDVRRGCIQILFFCSELDELRGIGFGARDPESIKEYRNDAVRLLERRAAAKGRE
ncbi:MAG: hypothetical protein AB1324_04380 [Candidatus Micrarchaeota archaeon]